MKTSRLCAALLVIVFVFVLTGSNRETAIAQSAVPLVVIVRADFPQKDLSLALLKRIFQGDATDYGGSRMVPFNYVPDNALRRSFDKKVLDMAPAQVGAYWIDRRIRGQGMPPRTVPTTQIMKAVVAKLSGAIGYIPADQLDATVIALTIDGTSFKAPAYPLK